MSLPIIQYIKYREYLACGRYSQPYSADGSSNAAFHCQCCSNTANKHMHTVLIHDRLTATATILVFRVVNNLTQRPKTQSRTATWLPVHSPSESLFSTEYTCCSHCLCLADYQPQIGRSHSHRQHLRQLCLWHGWGLTHSHCNTSHHYQGLSNATVGTSLLELYIIQPTTQYYPYYKR